MDLSAKIEEALQGLVKTEQENSQAYLALSQWCQYEGFFGAAKFYADASKEESEHAGRVLKYLQDRNAQGEIRALSAPVKQDFALLKETIQAGLMREEMTLSQYAALAVAASGEKDIPTQRFAEGMVEFQVSEVAEYQDLLKRAERVPSEYFLDIEMGK